MSFNKPRSSAEADSAADNADVLILDAMKRTRGPQLVLPMGGRERGKTLKRRPCSPARFGISQTL
jgi:hypothetical protein